MAAMLTQRLMRQMGATKVSPSLTSASSSNDVQLRVVTDSHAHRVPLSQVAALQLGLQRKKTWSESRASLVPAHGPASPNSHSPRAYHSTRTHDSLGSCHAPSRVV
eukprot:1193727-Rhodomonas_salina.1